MFGIISPKKRLATHYLSTLKCSLRNQAIVGNQVDGWGIGFFSNVFPTIIKSEKPVYRDEKSFNEVVRQAESTIIIAHVRSASNPRGLQHYTYFKRQYTTFLL